MKKQTVLRTAFIAMFSAIICIGCFIKIPFGLIPLVFQNILCILCAVLLGGINGVFPTLIFLLAGSIGLPVFSGGSGGFSVWLSPTGGFLLGYLLGALVSSLLAGKPKLEEKIFSWKNLLRLSLSVLIGMIVIYIPGVLWFLHWVKNAGQLPEGTSVLSYAFASCVFPFILGDLIKVFVAVPVAVKLRPLVAMYLYEQNDE